MELNIANGSIHPQKSIDELNNAVEESMSEPVESKKSHIQSISAIGKTTTTTYENGDINIFIKAN